MRHMQRMIAVASVFVVALAASILPVKAQTYWYTPGGSGVNGAVGMCLNAVGLAVPCSDPSTLPSPISGAYPYNKVGSTITRPADTTAYAVGQTICAAKTVTPCVPGTIPLAATVTGKATIGRVTLLKSGSSVTTATFTIWFFSAAPGLTSPTQYDATAYSGPRAADMPNYIGSAACNTPIATSDTTAQVWYECTLSNPNTSGALVAQALSGSLNIDYLISATAAYTPASAEQFTPYVSGFY